MPHLAIKYQVILAPLMLIILIIGILLFFLTVLTDISQRNDSVRELGRATDQIQVSIATGQKLHLLIEKLQTASAEDKDDLVFQYEEQSGLLRDSATYADIIDNISTSSQQYIHSQLASIRYSDNIELEKSKQAIRLLSNKMDAIYTSLHAKKRALYISSYENIKNTIENMTTDVFVMLMIIVALGILVSVYMSRTITMRLNRLSQRAQTIASGQFEIIPEPASQKDELDKLELYLSRMTHRLIDHVSAEKVVEGAEHERRRIAMDIHDQILADINHLFRYTHELSEDSSSLTTTNLDYIKHQLTQLTEDLRKIINDLHPQSLDTLGLECAIRSWLEHHHSANNMPEYYLQYGDNIDSLLSSTQRLALYRIILEIVNNIIQHAKCSRYELDFRMLDSTLIFLAEDNGTGMDVESINSYASRGIFNVTQRARAIGASITWSQSRFSSGLRFELTLAINK